MTRHLSPRRLSLKVPKARPVDKQGETVRRIEAGKSGMQSDRRRGWHRGARR